MLILEEILQSNMMLVLILAFNIMHYELLQFIYILLSSRIYIFSSIKTDLMTS